MGGSWSAERGVKRRHEDTEAENESLTGDLSDSSTDLHTPKRKRFQSTAQYIVKKLFEEGTDSDVTIQALGKSWHLHKLYLSQCKYFDSMFNGQWAESEQPDIAIEITDENIDTEALRIAFKSLYTDSILVKPIQAIGVLAAATFLQLDPLIEHCRLVMKGCITCKTVCSFLAASECYGLQDVQDLCVSWLLRCIMVPKNAFMLSDITEEVLGKLLDGSNLWLMQVEVDVYCQLKKWMFTQLNRSWSGTSEQLYVDASDFFKQQAESNGCCFLETAEGRRFIRMFDKVRWMYIINDSSSIQSLKDDQIVPYDWLNPVFKFCWTQHLRTEQGLDTGPKPGKVKEEDFYRWSMRCGRILMHEQEYHWRWLGYAYGLDLLFTLRNKVLTINRNCGTSQRFTGSLSQQETRHVMLSVQVAPVRKKEICPPVSTGIRTLSLHTDDVESLLLTLNPATKFPLQVTMHLLYLTPDPTLPYPSLAPPPLPVDVVPALPPLPSPSCPNSSRGGEEGEGDCQRQAGWAERGGGGSSEQAGVDVLQAHSLATAGLQLDSPVGGQSSTAWKDVAVHGASGRTSVVLTSPSPLVSSSSLSPHRGVEENTPAPQTSSSGAGLSRDPEVTDHAQPPACSVSSPSSSSVCSLALPATATSTVPPPVTAATSNTATHSVPQVGSNSSSTATHSVPQVSNNSSNTATHSVPQVSNNSSSTATATHTLLPSVSATSSSSTHPQSSLSLPFVCTPSSSPCPSSVPSRAASSSDTDLPASVSSSPSLPQPSAPVLTVRRSARVGARSVSHFN